MNTGFSKPVSGDSPHPRYIYSESVVGKTRTMHVCLNARNATHDVADNTQFPAYPVSCASVASGFVTCLPLVALLSTTSVPIFGLVRLSESLPTCSVHV